MNETASAPHAALDEPDLHLVLRARADPDGRSGKEAASVLLLRYQRRVYGWCYRFVGEHEKALDLSQETLLSAYRNLHLFEARAQFSSWLFSIARNRCLCELRRPSVLREDPYDGGDDIPCGGKTPEDMVADQLDEERLLGVIRDVLEPDEQQALWLRCIERMPVGQITEVLGISSNTGARAILQRARRKLRAALGARKIELGGI